MARFPQDQFDELPDDLERVGAHRAPARKGRGWINLGIGILAVAVLVIGGLYGLSRLNPEFALDLPDFSEPTPDPTVSPLPTAEAVTDPASVDRALRLSISVFNASENVGAQDAAGEQIQAAGWPNPVRANAASTDLEETAIYYWNADFEGIARGLAELLGVGSVVLSDAYPGAPVTVVLGADYAPPAD